MTMTVPNAPTLLDRLQIGQDDFLALPMHVRIRWAATPYLYGGWSYPEERTTPVRVAYPCPPAPKLLVASGGNAACRINCSTMTASVLIAATPGTPWTTREYAELQSFAELVQAGRWDGPGDALRRMGLAWTGGSSSLSRVSLVQGWWGQGGPEDGGKIGGHAFFLFKGWGSSADAFWMLHSTSVGLVGPTWSRVTMDTLRKRYPRALYVTAL